MPGASQQQHQQQPPISYPRPVDQSGPYTRYQLEDTQSAYGGNAYDNVPLSPSTTDADSPYVTGGAVMGSNPSAGESPVMYPVRQQQQQGQGQHQPKPSVDIPDYINHDGASAHSHSPIIHVSQQEQHHQHQAGHRARFDSQSLPQSSHQPAGTIQPVDFAEKDKSTRSLPHGYATPPVMSRQSSGWSSFARNGGGAGGEGVYGPLGGVGSKSDPALQFAEGDYATNRFARFWLYLVSKNIWIRWALFIIPVLALLWIPGIVWFAVDGEPRVWAVSLLNWSIWLSVAWVGWWAAMLFAMYAPKILRATLGTVAPELRHTIEYLFALKKTLAGFMWTLAMWISFQPLIQRQAGPNASDATISTLSQITKGLFAIWICAIILLVEKLVIQVVAYNFHKTSYADRIAENKFAVRSLVTLYLNSRDIGRSDTLDGAAIRDKEKLDPSKILKRGLKGAKKIVTGTSTALGTVASEIVGERVLQSNSPQSMVTAALASANKSRQLARRIFFSFTPRGRDFLSIQDIAPYFPNAEHLQTVYAIFDRDQNGDVQLEEIEMAVLEIHRERLSLASSMRDLDSAVGRLDQILMSLYYVVAALIIAAVLSVSFSTLATSGATFILGLSWLIGATAQEVLSSVIFLLAKHPYDVGDLIVIDGMEGSFVVKEIALLSTVFKKTDGNVTQIPHTVLNTKAIQNYRRSGPTSETYSWDVDFGTTFPQIEALQQAMVEFCEHERRDFLPNCNISIQNFEGQAKLSLSASIPYKTNWSNSALKSQRRNKWICALKIALGDLKIYGPGGAGNPSPAPADPTVIKLLDPSGAAPPYRSTSSSTASSPHRPGDGPASTTPLPSGESLDPSNLSPRVDAARSPQSPGSPSLAAEVRQLGFSNRGQDTIADEATDIYSAPGQANRVDTLNFGEAVHAADVQVNGRNTALDNVPSTEGASLRAMPQDIELGRMQPARPR